jgi:hypothetical protein
MKKETLTIAILGLFLLSAGSIAYIIPKDSFDLKDYYDIANVNELNATTGYIKTLKADDASNLSITASQISDQDAGTDITADLEEETHCPEHDGNYLSCDGEELDVDNSGICGTCSFVDVEIDPFWTANQSLYATLDSPIFTTAFTSSCLVGDEDLQSEDFGSFTCAGEDACTLDAGSVGPTEIDDVDDADVETDLNTYVDIAGDTMTDNLTLDTSGDILIDTDNKGTYYGEDQDAVIYWDGTYLIIETL